MFTQLDYMEKRGSPSGTTFAVSYFESGGQLIENLKSIQEMSRKRQHHHPSLYKKSAYSSPL